MKKDEFAVYAIAPASGLTLIGLHWRVNALQATTIFDCCVEYGDR